LVSSFPGAALATIAEKHHGGDKTVTHFFEQTFKRLANGGEGAVGGGGEVLDHGRVFSEIAAADFEFFREFSE
jgi:hypothetical protein